MRKKTDVTTDIQSEAHRTKPAGHHQAILGPSRAPHTLLVVAYFWSDFPFI